MKDFDSDNEIIELDSNDDIKEEKTIEETHESREEKYKKKSLKEKWNDLDKKKKILIITIISIVLLLIIIILVYFLIFKDSHKEEDNPKKDDTQVILKDNYKYVDGNLIFLDKNDKEIGKYTCTNKSDNLCSTAKSDNNSDEFDQVKNLNIDNTEILKSSPIYYDKYVFLKDGEDIFLYDLVNEERLIELKSFKIYNTLGNLVVVEDTNNLFGLIEIKESEYVYLIRASYDYLGIVNNDLVYLVAKDGNNKYIINSNGDKLSKNILATTKSVNKDYIVGKVNNEYSLYDYNYDELVSDYDYIALHDNVIVLVKSNRIYLLDKDLHKLNEDGIRLDDTKYLVPVNIYENNKLKETNSSYGLEVKNNTVYLTIGNNIKQINMFEGIVSSNYEYLNYFDGKLYFYSDDTKEDLIGSYSCINKNNLTSKDDKLSNCMIYQTEDKISGIYNNEYVFIYDNLSNQDHNIYLYDLKLSRQRSTYSDIKFVSSNELNDSIKQIYTSKSYIISKSATGSNAGNYGVLVIDSNGVSGKVDYKYKEIKKDRSYYLLISTNNNYSIYDSDFEKITNDFDYIVLYDKYYAGISNHKLNIYRYDNALGILDNTIDIDGTDFEIDFSDGFKITIKDAVYEFDSNGRVKSSENTPGEDNEE